MLKIKAIRWGYIRSNESEKIAETWLINPQHITGIHFVTEQYYSDGKVMHPTHVMLYLVGKIGADSDGSFSDPLRIEDADSIARLMKLEEATAENNFGM